MAICSAVEDCDKPAFHKGWCVTHYERWKTHGDFTTVKKPGNPRSLGNCQIDDGKGPCGRPAVAKGLCGKHYQRWAKFGDATVTKLNRDLTPEERLLAKVDKNGPIPEGHPELGPCWLWTAALREGYAAFSINHRHIDGHRAAYKFFVGDVPDDMQLDHVCHTVSIDTCPGGEQCPHRRCVNPAHLEPVTALTNYLRGFGSGSSMRPYLGLSGLPSGVSQ